MCVCVPDTTWCNKILILKLSTYHALSFFLMHIILFDDSQHASIFIICNEMILKGHEIQVNKDYNKII